VSEKKVFLSCVTASLIFTSGHAMSQDIVIADNNTTGVILQEYQGLNITSTGSIENNNLLTAVDSNSSYHINNSGKIIIHSDSNSSVVMGIKQNINMSGDIVNTGSIDISDSNISSVVGINENVIYSPSETTDINNSIYNLGKIVTNSSNASAVGISIGSLDFKDDTIYLNNNIGNINGNVINSGNIVANGKKVAVGILEFSNGNDSSGDIENSGKISVDGNKTAIGIYRGSDGNMSGDIINSGIITVTGKGQYTIGIAELGYDLSNANIINSGTITAPVALWVDGNSNGYGYGSTISNSGTINTNMIATPYSTLTNSGTINLHGTQTSYIGTFTQTASGTLSIDANISADGNAANPTIQATNATLADGSTIHVNVISDSSTTTHSFLDNNGTVTNVITSEGTIDTNTSKLNITDSSPILDFKAFTNDTNTTTTLNLKAIKAATVSPADSPLIPTVAPTVNMQVLNVLNTVIQTRQNNSRGMGSGDTAFKDKHLWIKPFGAYSKQDDKDGKYGFDAHTYGVGIGTDGEYKQGNRAGLAFFYSNTDLDVNHVSQSNSMDAYNIMAYGSNPIFDDKTMLFYQAGFGWQKNHSKRYASLVGKIATADYTSKTYYIQAKVARSYALNDKLTLVPAIKGSYRHFRTPSYAESGAGSLNNLSVQSNSTSQTLLGASTDLNYKINDTTTFISNLALNYDFNNNKQSVNAFFVGTPNLTFNTQGIKNSAFGYELGLGVSKQLKKNLTFNVKYDLSARGSNFIDHALMAKFRWTF